MLKGNKISKLFGTFSKITLLASFLLLNIGALVDPTKPLDNLDSFRAKPMSYENEDFVLNSILESNKRDVAVINGEVLSVGDVIQDYTVKEINQDNVILIKGSEIKVLMLQ